MKNAPKHLCDFLSSCTAIMHMTKNIILLSYECLATLWLTKGIWKYYCYYYHYNIIINFGEAYSGWDFLFGNIINYLVLVLVFRLGRSRFIKVYVGSSVLKFSLLKQC